MYRSKQYCNLLANSNSLGPLQTFAAQANLDLRQQYTRQASISYHAYIRQVTHAHSILLDLSVASIITFMARIILLLQLSVQALDPNDLLSAIGDFTAEVKAPDVPRPVGQR